MTKQRIAMISVHGDPGVAIGSEGAGGQNVYVREVALQLAGRGHVVHVFTRLSDPQLPELEELAPGALIVRLSCGGARHIGREALQPILATFEQRLVEWIERHDEFYDVIHSNYWISGSVGLPVADTLQIPLTHTSHSLGGTKLRGTGGEISPGLLARLNVESQLVGRAAMIATNEAEASDLKRLYGLSRPAALIPCGYDAAVFHPRDRRLCRRALGLPPDAPIVLYAGRFDAMKGIDTLVRAAGVLRMQGPIRLVLVGGFKPGGDDEREHRRTRALVRELGLEDATTSMGAVDHSTLAWLYSAADVVCIPSHYESFGLVAIEAMACGTPVVASAVGGLACSVVDGQTGFLAPVSDVPAFTSALSKILADPGLAARLGAQAARRAQAHYTWAKIARMLEQHYGQLSRSSPGPRTRRASGSRD